MVNRLHQLFVIITFGLILFGTSQLANADSPYDLITDQGELIPYTSNAVTSTSSQVGYQDTSAAENIPVDNSFTQEETIIGSDNRIQVTNTTVFPNSASVFIKVTYANGKSFIGSGSMISPDTVLTAGHVIYDKGIKQWAKSVTVYPGVNGSYAPFGHATSTRLASLSGWTNNFDSKYDIGMIRLTAPLGTKTGWLGITTTASVGQSVTSTGYPGDKPAQTMWTMTGKISSLTTNNVYYPIDTFGGQSGSPVFNSSKQIVAVHAYGQSNINFGTRTNSSIYNWIQNDLNNIKSIYRVYNPNSGEHFYTANGTEVNNLKKAGWRDEGLGWFAPSSGNNVYRMYNPNSGTHHYTIDANEKDSLIKAGWRYEGVSWFSDTEKRTPLYRLYNPNAKSGTHHYTPLASERDSLSKAGWRYEGIAWYGL